jgi:hypothetical protein
MEFRMKFKIGKRGREVVIDHSRQKGRQDFGRREKEDLKTQQSEN